MASLLDREGALMSTTGESTGVYAVGGGWRLDRGGAQWAVWPRLACAAELKS